MTTYSHACLCMPFKPSKRGAHKSLHGTLWAAISIVVL